MWFLIIPFHLLFNSIPFSFYFHFLFISIPFPFQFHSIFFLFSFHFLFICSFLDSVFFCCILRDTEARRRKEKSEQSQYLNLRVVTEDEMVIHQGHELVDFEKIMSKKPYRVRKDLPLAQLKETLAEWFGYKAEQIAFWPWQTRQNGSSRPTHLMDNEALMMEQHTVQDLSSMSRAYRSYEGLSDCSFHEKRAHA